MRIRYLSIALLLLAVAAPVRGIRAAALERGTAMIDPAALRELDGGQFGIGRMLQPERSATTPLADRQLFALPSMLPVRQAIDREFERYITRHKVSLPNETIVSATGLISSCSTERCWTPPIRGSCWRVSSTGWTAPMSGKPNAARSG